VINQFIERNEGDNMPKKDIKDMTPEDVVRPPLPDKMPSMTKKQIREERDKITKERIKKLHIISERRQGAIRKIGETYYVNPEMIRNEEELARQLKTLEDSIRAGNKDQVKIKTNILKAKTKMTEAMVRFDKEKEKILQEFKEKRDRINAIDAELNVIRAAKQSRAMDAQRATAAEVDELQDIFKALKKEVSQYKLDRHLVARVEHIQTEIEILKQQNQKIFQLLKAGGLGR
jgi:DNA repair exonuclease SbcCD ATPase subunit